MAEVWPLAGRPRYPPLVATGRRHAAGGVGTRLYLRRYWQYEQSGGRPASTPPGAPPICRPRPARRRSVRSSRRLPGAGLAEARLRAGRAGAFAIVTGGPGTGKTTTVVRLLAVLQALAIAGRRPRPAHPPGGAHRQGRRPAQRIHRRRRGQSGSDWPADGEAVRGDPRRGDDPPPPARQPSDTATSATTPATRCRWTCWWWTRRRWSTWR